MPWSIRALLNTSNGHCYTSPMQSKACLAKQASGLPQIKLKLATLGSPIHFVCDFKLLGRHYTTGATWLPLSPPVNTVHSANSEKNARRYLCTLYMSMRGSKYLLQKDFRPSIFTKHTLRVSNACVSCRRPISFIFSLKCLKRSDAAADSLGKQKASSIRKTETRRKQ